ncbi:MAG: GAF domain-containing protein, partial [Pedobacter sp.]
HIACATASRSEIVLPFYNGGEIIGVLDVDSEHLAYFDEVDARYLEQVLELLNG